jgi:hypothetical protein
MEQSFPVEVFASFEVGHRRHTVRALRSKQQCIIDTSLHDTVKLMDCTGGEVRVCGKHKILLVDTCRELSIVVQDGSICAIEVVNSAALRIQIGRATPLVAVDKSTEVELSAVGEAPEIVTASSSGVLIRASSAEKSELAYQVPTASSLGLLPEGRQCLTVFNAASGTFSTGPFERYVQDGPSA